MSEGFEEKRFKELEATVRDTQESILLMGRDMHQMSQNVTSIATSMKTLVQVQQDMKVQEERNESRHKQLRDADKVLHLRVDTIMEAKKIIEVKADNGNRAYNMILWAGKIIGSSLLLTAVGVLIWGLQQQAIGK